MLRNGLLFLGIMTGVAGSVAATVTASWSTTPTILLGLGLFLLGIRLWLWGQDRKFWQRRSTKRGFDSIAKTIVVLALVGLINWLGLNHEQRWDFTENQLHTLSEQSQTIINQLEQPLEVLVFNRNIDQRLENLLGNYRRHSEKFQFRFIDPEQEIGLAQEFGVQSLGEIHLQYAGKRQKLNSRNAASEEALTEGTLTNGIAKIQRDRPRHIYLLQGHGEAPLDLVEGGLAQGIEYLEEQGNLVEPLNLAVQGQIPADANLIIVAGARRKLIAAEVTMLQQYLRQGGNLLMLLIPNTDVGLQPILQNWGIELDNRVVVDGSEAVRLMGFGPGVTIVNTYGNHPITNSFRNGLALFPEASPLKIVSKPEITSTALVTTNPETWAESNLKESQITFNPGQDSPGPLQLAIAATREQPEPSRLVVFGGITFATNGWFEQQLNGDLWLNSISWLTGEPAELLSIRPRATANRRINLSAGQITLLEWLALGIMPLLALFTGTYLWWSHR